MTPHRINKQIHYSTEFIKMLQLEIEKSKERISENEATIREHLKRIEQLKFQLTQSIIS